MDTLRQEETRKGSPLMGVLAVLAVLVILIAFLTPTLEKTLELRRVDGVAGVYDGVERDTMKEEQDEYLA